MEQKASEATNPSLVSFYTVKNPFEKQTDRDIRNGLIFGCLIYSGWVMLALYDPHAHDWIDWLVISLLFTYNLVESLRELQKRKCKP